MALVETSFPSYLDTTSSTTTATTTTTTTRKSKSGRVSKSADVDDATMQTIVTTEQLEKAETSPAPKLSRTSSGRPPRGASTGDLTKLRRTNTSNPKGTGTSGTNQTQPLPSTQEKSSASSPSSASSTSSLSASSSSSSSASYSSSSSSKHQIKRLGQHGQDNDDLTADYEDWKSLSQEDLLLSILDSERDTAFFRAFLKSEFIDELLDFYLIVDEWRELWLRSVDKPKRSVARKARSVAAEIYCTYIMHDAPRLINIPSQDRHKIVAMFEPLQMSLNSSSSFGCLPSSSNANSTTQSIFDIPQGGKLESGIKKVPKVPKSGPELDALPLTETIFDSIQATTFNMLLEPLTRFVEDTAFRRLQTDRLKRSLKTPASPPRTRRQLLKARRPVKFDDLTSDSDIHDAFYTVLTKEYSEDYLSFWIELHAFRTTVKHSELHKAASRLYENYVVKEKIYVPPEESASLAAKFESGRIDRFSFDTLKLEIESVLKTKFSNNFSTICGEVEKARRQKSLI